MPLVQNGSMTLKIVAERKAGFTRADHDLSAVQSAGCRLGFVGDDRSGSDGNDDADERGRQCPGS